VAYADDVAIIFNGKYPQTLRSYDRKTNKKERYIREPRLSDTRYLAKGTKEKWRYASSKARLKCATYPRS